MPVQTETPSAETALPAPPRSFEELRSEITRRYGELSARLQHIGRFLLDHPDDIAFMTVAQVAESAKAPPSGIVRFAQTFGFDGFSDLQQVFRDRLVARPASYRDRIRALTVARGAAAESVLEGFIDDDIASLAVLRDAQYAAKISHAADILAKAETVYLIARGRAFPVAFYLAYALSRLERRSQLLDGVGALDQHVAELIGPNDALIAVTFRPYTPLVVEAVAACAAREVPVVAFTDSPVSPVAGPARVLFEIVDRPERQFRSLVAGMCLSEALIVTLGQRLGVRGRE